ncbi:MAG: acetyl-CoA carboxylase biotin carboxylase subunit [Bacteroidetes bacterium]|jgi:acetyl-CoA carboxylase biotin carboxylase subunit|nr:acetyl-CoA carboxylase biotin carboxylase subunit [Bacteroidota bacterium]
MVRSIHSLLVANRGEIACRVIRTCRDMGIESVAVCSDVDRASRHVQMADRVVALGGATPAESYLRQEKIIEAARHAGVDAIHPGYGFLSENPSFAQAVTEADLTFIGPSAEAIRAMGDKTAARKRAQAAGVPTVPGTIEPLLSDDEARTIAEHIGYPVLLKAAAGGGGKGMRIVNGPDALTSALRGARSEAKSAFGDDRIYVEKYVQRPRHIEMQIISDGHGNVVFLGERECSIQRRHQKVMEETPSPIVTADMRAAMGEAAVALVKSAGYVNAGTIEFIVDADRRFYFLEMNTRLQVEHPVTEMVTGLDLVREQIRVAEGRPLSFGQDQVVRRGHAIECRICAEDPANNFFPSTGRLRIVEWPSGPFIRVDSGVQAGDEVSVFYDPLLAKVIAWGADRSEAIERMDRALGELVIAGVRTTAPFCRSVLRDEQFVAGEFDTHFVADRFRPADLDRLQESEVLAAAVAVALHRRSGSGGPLPTREITSSSSRWGSQRR